MDFLISAFLQKYLQRVKVLSLEYIVPLTLHHLCTCFDTKLMNC